MNWKKHYETIKVGDKVRFVMFVCGNMMEENNDIKFGRIFTISSITHNNPLWKYKVKENNCGFPEGELEKV